MAVEIGQAENPAVTNFREYLRIKTVEPDPDYDGAIAFLKRMAAELRLPLRCVEVHPGKTFAVITWEGRDPSLQSILLNSHMDVVPASAEDWICDPFEAKKIDGYIYGRGAQDMKCVGIQYLEAIRRMLRRGERPLRTLHVLFSPDEEIGGLLGMKLFVQTPEFRQLNVGFALDEGVANRTEVFDVYYAERATWWIMVTCTGDPSHAASHIRDTRTAAHKANLVLNAFLEYREEEKKRLKIENGKIGNIQTVNLTGMSGGVALNIIPQELKLRFDLRLSPLTKPEFLEKKIEEMVGAGGKGVSYEWLRKGKCNITPVDDNNIWWKTFQQTCGKEKLQVDPLICPGATDMSYLRHLGIPALGFSPMNHTRVMAHRHNERLSEEIFLRGIEIYESLIPAFANVSQTTAKLH